MAARRSPAHAPHIRFRPLPAAITALAAAAGLLGASALVSPAFAQTAQAPQAVSAPASQSQPAIGDPALHAQIETRAKAAEARLIAWRRDIHQHPELGNYEVRTAKLVADHLRKLGMEVKTGVAKTGVVGLLKGGKPGPVVALRADMDALPVKERVDVPFASKAKGKYLGKEVDVMHACGHDTHVAILMAA